jgi:hypothetical protein
METTYRRNVLTFEVNDSKLENEQVFSRQLKLLFERYNLTNKKTELSIGYTTDQLETYKQTLKVVYFNE